MKEILDKFQEALRVAIDAVDLLTKESLKVSLEKERLEAKEADINPRLLELQKREAACEKVERSERFIKDTELLNVKNQEERARLSEERQKFELLKHEQEMKHKEQLILIANGWKELRG